jgi:hypothetical protein
MQVFTSVFPMGRVDLAKLMLLRHDLDHQAFAQIPRSDPRRIQMLDQIDSTAYQVEGRRVIQFLIFEERASRELAKSLDQLFLTDGEIAIFIEIANDEFSDQLQAGFN